MSSCQDVALHNGRADNDDDENTVPLHRLCENCDKFLQGWDVLDSILGSDDQQDRKWPHSFLCTGTYLLESQEYCHFCKLLDSTLSVRNRSEGGKNANIYLCASRNKGELIAYADWAFGTPVGDDGMKGYVGFSLEIYNGSDLNMGFNQHITARRVPLLARDNVRRARDWISQCLTHHGHCREFHDNTVDRLQRPTRVLEVTESGARLRCDMANEDFEYLALSHMWGKEHEQQLQLLETNLEEFQIDIPWDKLCASVTFKEAIRVTRILGFRYLWIDSLCIIQNSASDWKNEARRMAIVYGNATCNIAYLFPPNTSSQPTTRNDPRTLNPCILRPASLDRPGVYIEHCKKEWMFHKESPEQDWLVPRKWPLFDRAWTFQEYLLSPRTLLVGHRNLMFQCSEVFCDELLGVLGDSHGMRIEEEKPSLHTDMGKSRYFPVSLKVVAESNTLTSPAVLSFMGNWWDMVIEYRVRQLSYAEDRVMAFAGVARAYQQLGRLTYLGGAWKECLPLALLWRIDKANNIGYVVSYDATITEPTTQPAPTWSWFSLPMYAFYQVCFLLDEDELSSRRKSNRKPQLFCFDDIAWASTRSFQFGSHPVNHFPDSGFFDFADLSVTLSMRTFPMSANLPADLSSQMNAIQCTYDEEFDCSPTFRYYPDTICERRAKKPPKNGLLGLVAEFQILRTAGKFHIQRRLAGLMLVPGERRGTWRRVGVWKLCMRVFDVVVDQENIAAVARRWKEYRIVSERWKVEDVTLV